MALDGLKHAAWILQRFILQGRRPYERRNQRRESLSRLEFHGLCTDRRRLLPRVLPTRAVVLVDKPVERPFRYALYREILKAHAAPLRRFQAGKDSVQIFRVLEVLPKEGRRVCVVHDKGFEERVFVPAVTVNHIVDDAAQKGDIRTRAHRRVDVRDRAGAGEPRVDMNNLGAVVDFGLHRPPEGDGMVLRHVGTHDDDTVGVIHAPGVEGGRAAAESGPQTGDTRAVSYPRLVFDGDDAEPTHKLLMHVIELHLEGRATQGENRGGHVDELAAGKLFDEGLVASLFHQLSDPVHRAFEIPYLPIGRAGGTVQDLGWTVRVDVELKDRRAFGTESPLVVWAAGIPLDVDDVAIDRMDKGAAPHRTIGADARRHLGILDSELLGSRDSGSEIDAGADQASEGRASGCANRQSEKVTSGNFHGRTSNYLSADSLWDHYRIRRRCQGDFSQLSLPLTGPCGLSIRRHTTKAMIKMVSSPSSIIAL